MLETVLMLEKGSEHRAQDFPKTNWNLRRWLWMPRLGFRGEPEAFEPTTVAVHFGEPGESVPDPYFEGHGPPRKGCIRCGSARGRPSVTLSNACDKMRS